MIPAIIALVLYIIIYCLRKKLNVVDYVKENYIVLLLTLAIMIVVGLFGKTGMMLVIVTFLAPFLLAYSVPALLTHLKELWQRIMGWVKPVPKPPHPDGDQDKG